MSIHRFILIFLLVTTPMMSAASDTQSKIAQTRNSIDAREQQMWNFSTRHSNFAETSTVAILSRCEVTQPPQALATPDPMLALGGAHPKVTVSFIVGIDGRVHDPLVLESSGSVPDHMVLSAVGSWRYRPATCNGAPMEVEGKIAFSSR